MIRSWPSYGHRVEHPAVGRMGNANRDIDLVAVDRAGDLGVVILSPR